MNISGKTQVSWRASVFSYGYTRKSVRISSGELEDAVVDSYQTDENGDRIRDEYGTDYPDLVTFKLIPEALDDGFVPLKVYVPVMESISEGLGDQSVYLALDWATLKLRRKMIRRFQMTMNREAITIIRETRMTVPARED